MDLNSVCYTAIASRCCGFLGYRDCKMKPQLRITIEKYVFATSRPKPLFKSLRGPRIYNLYILLRMWTKNFPPCGPNVRFIRWNSWQMTSFRLLVAPNSIVWIIEIISQSSFYYFHMNQLVLFIVIYPYNGLSITH